MKKINLNLTVLSATVVVVIASLIASCKCDKKVSAVASENDTDSTSLVSSISGTFDSIRNAFVYDIGDSIDITLPDGTVLKVGENSSENKLFKILTDDSYNPEEVDPTDGWITLDRVYFETGSDQLSADSQAQVNNIATILKNFPSAVLKIGGYTDDDGSDPAINQTMSDKRAASVVNSLVTSGVAADNVSGEGFGPQHPVCPANDTPECMAQNRRVDIKVKGK